MKTLDRYLIREASGPFVFGVVAFVLLFVSANVLFQLTELVIEQGMSLATATELFFLWLPQNIVLTFPLATLVAILVAFGRLSGDSEIVAMHAGGVSFRRLVVPLVFGGLLISLVTAALNEFVVPAAKRRAEAIVRAATERSGGKAEEQIYIKETSDGKVVRLVYADRLDVGTGEMIHPTIVTFGDGLPASITVAERGQWQGKHWQLFNGTIHPLKADQEIRFSFRSFRADLSTSPLQMAQGPLSFEEMTYRELRDRIRSLLRQRQPTAEPWLILHHKFSIPFACLVFVLVAAPLGVRSHRGSSAIGLGIAILIGFAYYVIWNYLAVMARQGAVSPFWAAWLPNIITAAVGLGLIFRVRR